MSKFEGIKPGMTVRITEEFVVERIGMHGELYYAPGEDSLLPEGMDEWEFWPTEHTVSVGII